MTEIRLEHVSYAYDNEKILEDINLQVTSGEVVSILGPSGGFTFDDRFQKVS